LEVIVQEGNTELPDGSLVVSGYDVSGKVTSENEPVAGVSFILFGVRFIFLLPAYFNIRLIFFILKYFFYFQLHANE